MNKRNAIKLSAAVILYSVFSALPVRADNYRQALNHYLDGNISAALEALEKAYEEAPGRSEVQNLYAEVLVMEAGRYYESSENEKAFELISRARELRPEDGKIGGVFDLLDNMLNPSTADLRAPSAVRETFSGVKSEHEERREERVRIIREPPEKITVRELELLRPIMVGSESDNRWMFFFAAGTGAVLLLFMVMTGVWIKKLAEANRDSLEAVSKSADEKVRYFEKEARRKQKEELAREMEEKEVERRKELNIFVREEKLKNEYSRLLSESLKASGKTSPRAVPEPGLSESESEKIQRDEIFSSFQGLKKTNYRSAVELLMGMAADENSWVRLWAGDLASHLEVSDAINILKALAGDREYQVKKAAFKSLKSFEDKKIPANEKEAVIRLRKEARSEGWVM